MSGNNNALNISENKENGYISFVCQYESITKNINS